MHGACPCCDGETCRWAHWRGVAATTNEQSHDRLRIGRHSERFKLSNSTKLSQQDTVSLASKKTSVHVPMPKEYKNIPPSLFHGHAYGGGDHPKLHYLCSFADILLGRDLCYRSSSARGCSRATQNGESGLISWATISRICQTRSIGVLFGHDRQSCRHRTRGGGRVQQSMVMCKTRYRP